MRMGVGVLIAVAAIAAVPAGAEETPAPKRMIEVPSVVLPQKQQEVTQAATKEKIICRSDTTIGSWVKRTRWCATSKEWKTANSAARAWTDDIQSNRGRYDARSMATDVYMDGGGHVVINH